MNDSVNPIPAGFHTVTPYLCVRDAPNAIEFYKKAFGATEIMRLVDAAGRIGHAEIKIGDSPLMLADEYPDFGFLSPQSLGGTPVRIHLSVADVDAWFDRAVGAGAAVQRPVADQFYGQRQGSLIDPFGHVWLLSTQIEVVSPEEMQRRFAPAQPQNKAELIEQITRSRSALEETLDLLDEAQLTTPGPSGWSVKDHLAHLATWELGIAELLRRRPRFAAMQVEDAVAQGKSEDEINDLIYRRHAGLPLAEVMDRFHAAHRRLLEALNSLGDEEIFAPYASFVPDGSDPRQDPVIIRIMGNTVQHFNEHHTYIRTLVQELQNRS